MWEESSVVSRKWQNSPTPLSFCYKLWKAKVFIWALPVLLFEQRFESWHLHFCTIRGGKTATPWSKKLYSYLGNIKNFFVQSKIKVHVKFLIQNSNWVWVRLRKFTFSQKPNCGESKMNKWGRLHVNYFCYSHDLLILYSHD